jgi:cytochrome c oxidase subunit III
MTTNQGLVELNSRTASSQWNEAQRQTSGQIGMWVFLATITMLFAGFTSAIFVRRTALDWQPVSVPNLLWFNTAVLMISSVTMQRVQQSLHDGKWMLVRRWLVATAILGALFVAGQVGAWRELAQAGVYVSSNPHSSFFYLLTGAHAVHLLGGVIALAYVLFRVRRAPYVEVAHNGVQLCAMYWHFLGGVWLYLFVILFIL